MIFWNKTIKEVKEKNEYELLKKLGVTGVGIGLKNGNGKESIIVLVDKKKPLEEISEQDLVPTTIDGKLTDVVEVGEVGSAANVGDSAVHEKGTACTLGAICYRGEQTYYLQNAHCGGEVGDSLVSPSPMDGKGKKIGTITEKYFTKKVDALLAKATHPHTETTNISQGNLNDFVYFHGRTSGAQEGRIIATDLTLNSRQPDGSLHHFKNQIMFRGRVRGGDSGSGLYKKSGICGLVHSSNFTDLGFANHIDDVIDVTGVTFSPTFNLRYFQRHEFSDYDKMDKDFLLLLDDIRHDAGIPFIVNSDYRTPEQNRKVGGVADSSHLTGLAVDIKATTSSQRYTIITSALKHGIERIGIGKTFVHIDNDTSKEQGVVWLY